MSGEHVVYGFVQQAMQSFGSGKRFFILHYRNQPPPEKITNGNFYSIAIANYWRPWFLRGLWEWLMLPRLVRKHSFEQILHTSGSITSSVSVPQLTLAMNPWGFVSAARSGFSDDIKAFLQRRQYRYALRRAKAIIFISEHLRSLYRESNLDCSTKNENSPIAYVGLDRQVFDSACKWKGLQRQPFSILSVSAYAPWKGVHTVIEALFLLRQKGIPATLSLVGPWPDLAYKKRISQQIDERGLNDAVKIHGKLDVQALHRAYATHWVFCLMSSCESFGIPAAEAMAFGTPVVSSDCCAIAEVCERAGLFGPVNQPHWTAEALESLFKDVMAWSELSENARQKAGKLTWEQCAVPFINALISTRTDSPSQKGHETQKRLDVQ